MAKQTLSFGIQILESPLCIKSEEGIVDAFEYSRYFAVGFSQFFFDTLTLRYITNDTGRKVFAIVAVFAG